MVKLSRLGPAILLPILLLCSCNPRSSEIEPCIVYFPQERHIQSLPSSFLPLTMEEEKSYWGKEMLIADHFACRMDLYRAITSYERALVLLDHQDTERDLEIRYKILLSYYLGKKYKQAIEIFETSDLRSVPDTFPAFRELMIILYESYEKTCQYDRAQALIDLIDHYEPETAESLARSTAIQQGNIPCYLELTENAPEKREWLDQYCLCAKSVSKAQTLNAVLPGAGYYYVGQYKTAITSFLLNAAFIAATWELIDHDLIAPAIITGSLEFGWYFGGINGAGLAAKAYNEKLYNDTGKETLICQRLFPILMFNYAF